MEGISTVILTMPRILVCGLGRTGAQIFSLLLQQGAEVMGVTLATEARGAWGEELLAQRVVIGDMRDPVVLERAGIQTADILILATGDDTLNLAVVVQARVLNPRVRIITRLVNTSLGDRLDDTIANHVSLSVAELAAPVFTFTALGSRAIGQLQLFCTTWPIQEVVIDANHPWLGLPLRDLWVDRNRMLIYFQAQEQVGESLVEGLYSYRVLAVGDRLVLAMRPSVYRRSSRRERPPLVRLAMALRRWRSRSRGTLMILVTLLVTLGSAMLAYMSLNLKKSPIDAFYFSVGMVTGAGSDDAAMAQAPGLVKLLTALLMLLGAAVVGLFYAVLNEFVLGAQFRQLWDVVQVPERDHYIICGLGSIGIQIAKQLKASGHEVVIVELDHQNRFLGMARSLHVPVLLGDASLATTLESANIGKAAALLSVTSSDITNIEIGLSAMSLVPKLPVIVRAQTPTFAQMAGQILGFTAVLSPSELSAPSFAATALGGRVLGNGLIGKTLWVALATLITPRHPFCDRVVKAVAIATELVPLYLETQNQTIHGWDLLETTLQVGDVLYLTMPAQRVEELWQSGPSSFRAIASV